MVGQSIAEELLSEINTLEHTNVTNITLTGSAMVNWSRSLLIQGVTTVIMVFICALGHCFGVSASKEGSMRSPGHHR